VESALDADVIILGGGPAGATLGCLLARGGHRALIVEREIYPREHVGELLTPSVNAVLHRIGLLARMDAEGFVRRRGIRWSTPRAPASAVLTLPVADYPAPRALRRYGYNVERDRFDAMLLSHARAAGVQVLEGAAARRVLFERERASGVGVQRRDGSVRALKGRFVADASGRRCRLGTQLKLVERDPRRRQCAMYAWFRGVTPCTAEDQAVAWVHVLDHHRAWAWQIPLRDGVTSVGAVAPCDRFCGSRADPSRFFARVIEPNRTLSRALQGASRTGAWHVVGDYSYRLRQLAGPGWLLLGDACGFIDPIFSSGVDVAMHSAVFAYEALLPLLLLGRWSDTDEQFALSRYESRLRQGTEIWSKAVESFYESPRTLRRLVQEPRHLPAICRFLQGDPYEVQNQLIVERLFELVHS
jgi:flavin-dependent dehydrogenase